jgi:hypothetical protein
LRVVIKLREYFPERADDRAGVMMLQESEAVITKRIAMAGELEGFPDRKVLWSPLRRRGLIEYR